MYTYRYSVFYISPDTYEDTIGDVSEFLRSHYDNILRFASNDRFKSDEEAIECAESTIKEMRPNSLIVIYDWIDRRWVKYWTK